MRWGTSPWWRAHLWVVGSGIAVAFTTVWTLLRFFTRPTIFDEVGQQVLARQWLDGPIGGAHIGITNYLDKTFLLYMPLDVLPGPPRTKLILLTLAINIATILLVALLVRRLLGYFGLPVTAWHWTALVWLGMLAGSVWWVRFANSRNLEVVGGLFLLERGLVFVRRPSRPLGVALVTLAAALFFADNLQIYMTALPLVLYGSVLAVRQRHGWRTLVSLVACLLGGYVVSRLLLYGVGHALGLQFLSPRRPNLQWSAALLGRSIKGTLVAYKYIFSGANDVGRVRDALNLLFAAVVCCASLYAAVRCAIPRRLIAFVVIFVALNVAVYMVSGQASLPATSRYLIMTVPILFLAASALPAPANGLRLALVLGLGLVVLVNAVTLSGRLARSWDTKFVADDHLYSVARYAARHRYAYVYGSLNTALPLSYLGSDGSTTYLPLECGAAGLLTSHLFYNDYPFQVARRQAVVPLILDGSAIANLPTVCSLKAIETQLGRPLETGTTDDGSVVLLYRGGDFARLPVN